MKWKHAKLPHAQVFMVVMLVGIHLTFEASVYRETSL